MGSTPIGGHRLNSSHATRSDPAGTIGASHEHPHHHLTGRPPVKIEEDDWNIIAQAKDKEHDGQVECQANRVSEWAVRVRQHDDGRAIVYATYSYTSNWQNARDYAAKRGVFLDNTVNESPSNQMICDAIREVCENIATAEHHDGDESRWATLAAECIADMPAEVL